MSAIYLMGFMGSGKSAVARQLSRQLGLPLVDLDQKIEQEIGVSIAEFFALQGEEAFRRVESKALEATKGRIAVVSLGGGVPTRKNNRDFLKNAAREGAFVVYLSANSDVLAGRIRRQPGKRPLIDGEGALDFEATKQRVAALLAERAPLYEETANLVLETSCMGIDEVAQEIAARWSLHK